MTELVVDLQSRLIVKKKYIYIAPPTKILFVNDCMIFNSSRPIAVTWWGTVLSALTFNTLSRPTLS